MSWQAALLHDIGKFRERALGPKEDHTARYTHEAHSREFIIQSLRTFLANELLERELSGAVLRHHNPQYKDELLISTADVIAADERAKAEDLQVTTKFSASLLSLLTRVRLGDARSQATDAYFSLNPLQLERLAVFPVPNALVTQEAYQHYWQAFHQEALCLPIQDWLGFFHLLRKYCWCIPSSAAHGEEHDISLYDHLRVTAAIAACLEAEGLSEEELKQIRSGDSRARARPLFLLVKGDISGIQDFIYTITSKGAAKGLRGRSVYLQLLTEIIAQWILRKLNLPFVNLLYHGGGHFMLLVPYKASEQLSLLHQEITQRLLTAHKTDLYLALGWESLTPEDFKPDQFPQKWREVGQRVGQAKQRRFSELDDVYRLFEPQGSAQRRCDLCQADPEPFGLTKDEEIEKCHLCISFERLGQEVASAQYLMISELVEEQTGGRGYAGVLARFGYRVDFLEQLQPLSQQDVRRAALYRLNDTDFLDDEMQAWAQQARARGIESSLGFRFLANVTPYDENDNVLDFDGLAAQSKGMERLGILRMDIDNLGRIFSQGIPNATVSRIATISSMIQLFFEGWVHQIACDERFQNKVYAIYSGGDDLFFVGAWDAIVELARQIREDFHLFTRNDSVTLSAGIVIEERKFPLYQAARNSGRALESAKARPGKNAIEFLGKTLSWSDFQRVYELQQRLVQLLQGRNDKAVPRSLLTKLSNAYALYKKYKEQRRPRWTIRLVYDITQLGHQYESFKGELQDLQFMIGQEGMIDFLDVSVRWAEMLTMTREERGRS